MTAPGSAAESHESDLIARAQRGDVSAFEALYRAHSGRVFAICLRMAGDRDRATELMQDAFVRVWEKLSSFRGDASFSTWIHRLSVNVVLEGARRDRRRTARVESEEDGGLASETHGVRPEAVAERIDLERAIATLAPGMRRVFVLHDIEGYQHNEIAQMTGTAEGTLRAQLHRARKLLMEALDR
jgi:RNA polymerase sigma-70 factor (ECF subfamily)